MNYCRFVDFKQNRFKRHVSNWLGYTLIRFYNCIRYPQRTLYIFVASSLSYSKLHLFSKKSFRCLCVTVRMRRSYPTSKACHAMALSNGDVIMEFWKGHLPSMVRGGALRGSLRGIAIMRFRMHNFYTQEQLIPLDRRSTTKPKKFRIMHERGRSQETTGVFTTKFFWTSGWNT